MNNVAGNIALETCRLSLAGEINYYATLLMWMLNYL